MIRTNFMIFFGLMGQKCNSVLIVFSINGLSHADKKIVQSEQRQLVTTSYYAKILFQLQGKQVELSVQTNGIYDLIRFLDTKHSKS